MGAPMGTPTPFVSQPAVNPAQGGKGASSSPMMSTAGQGLDALQGQQDRLAAMAGSGGYGSYSQMFANQFSASPNTRYVPKQYTTSSLSPVTTTPTAPLAPLAPSSGDNNGSGGNGPTFGGSDYVGDPNSYTNGVLGGALGGQDSGIGNDGYGGSMASPGNNDGRHGGPNADN